MSWHVVVGPVAMCQWAPWVSSGLSHAMVGCPHDFRASTRFAALEKLAHEGAFQPAAPVRWLRQTHSTILYGLAVPASAGISPYTEGLEGDGFVFRRGVLDGSVAITTADCLPVMMLSGDFGALVHAGWRGLADGIVTDAARRLFELSRAPIEVAIFPHASSRRYEVGEEVINAFPANLCETARNSGGNQQRLDLSATARAMMLAAPIPIAAWHDATKEENGCTISHNTWHSHRRDGEKSGRNATFVAIG